jgi:hypothetical protein
LCQFAGSGHARGFVCDPGRDAGRSGQGTTLTRIYHDIGLAAVADALDLLKVEFDLEMKESLERGEFYLLPADSEAVAGFTLAV